MLRVSHTKVNWKHLGGHSEITHFKLWRTQIWHNTAVFPFSSSLNLCLSFFSLFLRQGSDSVCRGHCPAICRHVGPLTSQRSLPKGRSGWACHYLTAKKKGWLMFLLHVTLNINKDLNLSAVFFMPLLHCFPSLWFPFSNVPSICTENVLNKNDHN